MALPTVSFNTGTGSDTAASGYGLGAVRSGAGAATDGTTTVDLSVDTPDLSVVSADDLLWVDSSSGRQWSAIASVDDGADTVTCDDIFTQTEGSRNWGIGGKRANWSAAAQLFADYATGWIIETETDQALAAALVPSVVGDPNTQLTIQGSTAHKIITQSGSALAHFAPTDDHIVFKNLQFKHSHATNQYAIVCNGGIHFFFRNCICGDAVAGDNPKGFLARGSAGASGHFVNCEAKFCTEDGFGNISTRGHVHAFSCWAHDCGRHGFATRGDSDIVLAYCLAHDNAGSAVYAGGSIGISSVTVINSSLSSNTADAITLIDAPAVVSIFNNNLSANTYGVNSTDDLSGLSKFFVDYNNYGTGADTYGGANTSGQTSNIDVGANVLAVDPLYTDAANDDFSIGDTTAKAGGFPDAASTIGAGQSSTTSFVDIGAAQREEAGGGFDGPSLYNVGPA